jgi:hypothetical protein
MNSRFVEQRKLPPLYLLEYLWTYSMQTFYDRRTFRQPHEALTRFGHSHVNHCRDLGRKMLCLPREAWCCPNPITQHHGRWLDRKPP